MSKILSDIEIAQSITPHKIKIVAALINLNDDDIENYGDYKAKIMIEKLEEAGY